MQTPESNFNDMLSKGLITVGPSWVEKAVRQRKNIPLGICNSIPLKLKVLDDFAICIPESKCSQN